MAWVRMGEGCILRWKNRILKVFLKTKIGSLYLGIGHLNFLGIVV
jgi:hypothetical protein